MESLVWISLILPASLWAVLGIACAREAGRQRFRRDRVAVATALTLASFACVMIGGVVRGVMGPTAKLESVFLVVALQTAAIATCGMLMMLLAWRLRR